MLKSEQKLVDILGGYAQKLSAPLEFQLTPYITYLQLCYISELILLI